jgi:hypothetical protein
MNLTAHLPVPTTEPLANAGTAVAPASREALTLRVSGLEAADALVEVTVADGTGETSFALPFGQLMQVLASAGTGLPEGGKPLPPPTGVPAGAGLAAELLGADDVRGELLQHLVRRLHEAAPGSDLAFAAPGGELEVAVQSSDDGAADSLSLAVAPLLQQLLTQGALRLANPNAPVGTAADLAPATERPSSVVAGAIRQALQPVQDSVPPDAGGDPPGLAFGAARASATASSAVQQALAAVGATLPDPAGQGTANAAGAMANPLTPGGAVNLPAGAGVAPRTEFALPEQVGGQRWAQALGERVLMMVGRDNQVAELRLNPPHLGPLEVRVSLHQDQASVTFLAQHAAVREALEQAIPRLRDMLSQQDLQLVQVDVSQRETGQQTSFGQPPSERGQTGGHAAAGGLAPAEEGGSGAGVGAMVARGLVDLFA